MKMFTCKDMEKIGQSEEKLSFAGKAQVKLHFFMCKNCRSFKANMKTLNRSLKSLIKEKSQVNRSVVKKLEDEIKKKFNL